MGVRAGVVLDITMEYFNYPSGVFGGMTTSSNFKVRARTFHAGRWEFSRDKENPMPFWQHRILSSPRPAPSSGRVHTPSQVAPPVGRHQLLQGSTNLLT